MKVPEVIAKQVEAQQSETFAFRQAREQPPPDPVAPHKRNVDPLIVIVSELT
jgi:hypothetical protein